MTFLGCKMPFLRMEIFGVNIGLSNCDLSGVRFFEVINKLGSKSMKRTHRYMEVALQLDVNLIHVESQSCRLQRFLCCHGPGYVIIITSLQAIYFILLCLTRTSIHKNKDQYHKKQNDYKSTKKDLKKIKSLFGHFFHRS